jgi:hypothetical protein
MVKGYFEPENLNALAGVLALAKCQLKSEDLTDPTKLDAVALRILNLAAQGMPPRVILREIASQLEGERRLAVHGDANAA